MQSVIERINWIENHIEHIMALASFFFSLCFYLQHTQASLLPKHTAIFKAITPELIASSFLGCIQALVTAVVVTITVFFLKKLLHKYYGS